MHLLTERAHFKASIYLKLDEENQCILELLQLNSASTLHGMRLIPILNLNQVRFLAAPSKWLLIDIIKELQFLVLGIHTSLLQGLPPNQGNIVYNDNAFLTVIY